MKLNRLEINKYWPKMKRAYYKTLLCIPIENMTSVKLVVLIYTGDLVYVFKRACLEMLFLNWNNGILIMSWNSCLEKNDFNAERREQTHVSVIIPIFQKQVGVFWPPGLEVNDASAHVFASWTCYISLLFTFTCLLLRRKPSYVYVDWKVSPYVCTGLIWDASSPCFKLVMFIKSYIIYCIYIYIQ